MIGMNAIYGGDENGETFVEIPVVLIENNDKGLKNYKEEPFDEDERNQEYHDCYDQEQEDLECTTLVEDGAQSPAEIKLKIRKSLLEFRCKVEDSILGNYLLGEQKHENLITQGEKIGVSKEQLRDISLWGVPLLPSKAHEGTDIVLMKFLKAKDYKVSDAFDMLQKTMIWRSENRIDRIMDEDLDSEMEGAGFLDSRDKEGRPVCYHVCGVFRDKDVYKRNFGTQKKREKFLRWRIQLMEKAVRKLSFREGGVDSIIQIYDLKHTPQQGMKELNSLSKKAVVLFQNYYPELVYKNIVVYAPFWLYTSRVLLSRFMNQRSKKKFILVRPQTVTKTFLKFINPEYLPAEYGGLRREKDPYFSPADKAQEHKIKGNTVCTVEFPVREPGVTITWEVTVVGWDVNYKEEFIPDDEGSYNILLQNQNRVGESTRNSFYINEPGKILVTVENGNFKTRRMFYRYKTRITVPMFILLSDR